MQIFPDLFAFDRINKHQAVFDIFGLCVEQIGLLDLDLFNKLGELLDLDDFSDLFWFLSSNGSGDIDLFIELSRLIELA